MSRRGAASLAVVATAALLLVAPVARAGSDVGPLGQTSVPTIPVTPPMGPGTSSPDTTTTTEPPPDTPPPTDAAPDTSVPDAQGGATGGGDGGLSPVGGDPRQIVPPDAAAFLASLQRSAPNDDAALVAGEQRLLAQGVEPDAAARQAYGRFPVAAPATWTDDWLDPRFDGLEFRYHLGIDVVAAYGSPLRSPADGTALVEQSDACGLTVKVVLADGTFFELCHLSATAPGLHSGQPVAVGDLLGAVGTSGDATGPHLHLGYWLHGATPTSAKSLLDQWASDAAAALAVHFAPATARSMLGATLTRRLADDTSPTAATDLLVVTAASPAGGALQVARSVASGMAGQVDWQANAANAASAATEQRRVWELLRPLLG